MRTPLERLKIKLFDKPKYPSVSYHTTLARSTGGTQSGLLLSYLLKTYSFMGVDKVIKRDLLQAKEALGFSNYDFNIAWNQLAQNKVFTGDFDKETKETNYYIDYVQILTLIKDNNTTDDYL